MASFHYQRLNANAGTIQLAESNPLNLAVVSILDITHKGHPQPVLHALRCTSADSY